MFPRRNPSWFEDLFLRIRTDGDGQTAFANTKPAGVRARKSNLNGHSGLGMGLGALIAELGAQNRRVVTGHDFRGYSASIKLTP